MRVVVCIKWVPNTEQIRFDPVRKTLIRAGVESMINPPDLNAIELALQIKDKYGAEVIVISMAPPFARPGLERAIAMGADKAILVSDRVFAGADTWATSYVLSNTIKKIGSVDLVLAGEETIDSSTGHVGPGIASFLNIPQVTYVVELIDLDVKERRIIVKRHIDEGHEIIEAELPALLTISVGMNEPREPTLRGYIRAKRGENIITWDNKILGLDPNCVGLKGSPTIVSDIDIVEPPPRKNEIIEAPPDEAAKWLAKKLIELGVV